eukprot:TRINITY_DN6119_c0_g1_i6.p2 TRINITY_DN6119_c0_g1~~TRINITY_DN6119_c0_g1_i6.p2  ORF type:complete len:558 (+),score=64.47 TRINITY_DN6119_c0_g1_i6:242-1915(+)
MTVHVGMDSTINPKLADASYAVRGAITAHATKVEEELSKPDNKLPFDKLTRCNIGNPQAVGQKPLTFPRQILAVCQCPQLLDDPNVLKALPQDVVERGKKIVEHMTIGAYTTSVGNQYLREIVAKGIEKRDNVPCDPEDVLLSTGASGAVHAIFNTMIKDKKDAFLVPVPQYPLYSAALTLYGGTFMPYYLEEETNWSIDVERLSESVKKAKSEGMRVRGMVVISPGNPTGQVLDKENQLAIIKMCAEHNVPIIADEVYQDNIWDEDSSFTAFRKVAHEAGIMLPIFSLHSTSKGFYGECGQRGGILEMLRVDPEIVKELKKLKSISLCPTTTGQILASVLMSPPEEGDASYALYKKERDDILSSLKRRAEKLSSALNSLDGISCTKPQGALYVFPSLLLPEKAMKAAEEAGDSPDLFYCKALVDATGIVGVPGDGFKQKDGSHHIRLTILPPEEQLDSVIGLLKDFNADFMKKYKQVAASSACGFPGSRRSWQINLLLDGGRDLPLVWTTAQPIEYDVSHDHVVTECSRMLRTGKHVASAGFRLQSSACCGFQKKK